MKIDFVTRLFTKKSLRMAEGAPCRESAIIATRAHKKLEES